MDTWIKIVGVTFSAILAIFSLYKSAQTPRKTKEEMKKEETIASGTNTQNSSGSSGRYGKKDFLSDHCQLIDNRSPSIYLAKNNLVFEDKGKRLKRVETAKSPTVCHERVIMLLGATGSRKTTLINAIFNFILGVKLDDDFRVKLIDEVTASSQAHSQTKTITAYTIHCHKWFTVPYTLTIVDTPGFGDIEI